jgi:Fibrobacter succinogenes major domain (Fib_succ_major).
MFASKSSVHPNSSPELMVFHHALAQLVVNLDNQAGAAVSAVTVKNLIPTAVISAGEDLSFTAAVDPDAAAADIKAEEMEAGKKYCVVVAPQSFDNFEIVLDLPGASSIVTGVDAAEIKAGYSYNVNITVSADQVHATIGGEIGNWEEGDNLDGKPAGPSFEEFDGYFVYDGVKYTTATMKDGNVWMTQNMRYVPKGLTPCSDLDNVTAGVYCPIVMNADRDAAEFSTSEDVIASNGYLYQIEAALGVPVGSVLTIESAQALNGAQGICPKGWHVPTDKEFIGLIGKIATYTYAAGESADKAPYYDQTLQNSSIALLNADGFNADAWGAVTVNDFTKTAAGLMGYLKADNSKIQSGFLCGSTYAACAYNTKDDPESGIKNIQFWGLMPMASNGTFNGAKLNVRTASPLRCVKNR